MPARALRVAGAVVAVCAVGALAGPGVRRFAYDSAFNDARGAAAERPGVVTARLIAPQAPVTFALWPRKTRGPALAEALRIARSDASPEAQHAAGVAALLSGDPASAVLYLSTAARGSEDAAIWTHLGAARHELARLTDQDEELLASLGASSHALVLQPDLPEAAYNFTLAIEQLGVTPAAAELWKTYLANSADDRWRSDARARLAALERRTPDSASWTALIRDADTDAELRDLARRYPQYTRLWAEGECLGAWAEASRGGDVQGAAKHLARARAVGEALRRATGESLLYEAVAAIDAARLQRHAERLRGLEDAHVNYSRGRRLYREENLRDALFEFEQGTGRFTLARSPMAAVTAAYAASALHDADRLAQAAGRVRALLSAERTTAHYALRAQLHYQLARLHSTATLWSDSLAEGTQALALYERVRERGNQGMTALLIAETYGYLGQPAVALRHGVDAIRLSAQAGDTFRLRVAAANLCRELMRRGEWDIARALIRVERSIEQLSPDLSMTTDTCIRAAIVEERLGRTAAAEQEVRHAAARAAQVQDEDLRASLAADIDGARGALARRHDPGRATGDLSRAIIYQEHAGRELLLPQLYLERARAHVALGSVPEALADLERGVGHLERQRGHVSDAGMRYGIFDDAHELFSDAVDIHLRERNVAAAFAMLERGRARALLEQIAGTPPETPAPVDVAAARRSIPPGTLLIEYAVLRDRLLLFVVARDLFEVRELRIDAATVAARANAFVGMLVSRRPLAEVQAAAAELHSLLIAPVPERARYRKLVLVPDAVLQQTPFAALYDAPRQSWLIQQHLLVTSPSLAVFLQGSRRALPPSRWPSRMAAVFAATRGDAALGLDALPDAELEAKSVAAEYMPSVLVENTAASVERFVADAPRYDVVHFAGHALLDAVDPSQSALVFAGGNGGPAALLRCRQIGTTDFHQPQVVVLAACSTMRGRTGRTDGTPSIARSFLAAGVPVVVGTLWDIEDGETATLIVDFHRNLAAGLTPAAALRDAQLAALRSAYPTAQHPGSWAAFAILGAGI
ncbi:MAG TPA: CHAT domain-containing protein [Thermoanaerobaculia bacterium]|nr:CHAT domain-containing protein [Thermoanaerobaculia bacterium]